MEQRERKEEGRRRQRGEGGVRVRCCINNPVKKEEKGRGQADGSKKTW